MKKILFLASLMILTCALSFAQDGVKKKRQRAYDYGQVILSNFSEKAGLPPVTFNHWTHRSKYTCRLCHLDLAFEMRPNATEISADDIQQGFYCGACHNGTSRHDGQTIFAACDTTQKPSKTTNCERCHQPGKDPQMKANFYAFSKNMPADRFGNKINWELAEEQGLITPIDFIESVSSHSAPMPVQKDFALNAGVESMPNILFSHQKHTVWNGCQTCHPDIFVGVKKGATTYNMIEIFEQKYCGVCHSTVAFPLQECQRCHTEAVQ